MLWYLELLTVLVGCEGQCLEGFPQGLLFLEVAVRIALPPSAAMLLPMWLLIPTAFLVFG